MSENKYIPTIGLEVHAELKTRTKMFCDSKNDPDEKSPNVNICPVCMGHPGTLPVINKEAVKKVLKFGVAVGGELADFTEFDRKNYFYPDIPKGYQISQYKYPLVKGGKLLGIELTRVHLEEDTATSLHDKGDYSLVDFNRAGVPLMELVTEPVIHTAKEAGDFGRELQLLLRYIDISEANMEKGEMRVEANISVSKDPNKFGTKVEVKNLNSFKSAEKAIEYEIDRQIKALEKGEEIIQETRGWDENLGKTFSQRTKEGAEDYRYFPEPDLPKLYISEIEEFKKANLDAELPELPWEKRERLKNEYGIKDSDIEIYVQDEKLGMKFEEMAKMMGKEEEKIKLLSNYVTSFYVKLMEEIGGEENSKLTPENFVETIVMLKDGKLSSTGVKEVLTTSAKEGTDIEKIINEKGLLQQNDEGAIRKIAEEVVLENPKIVEEYKGGKETVIQYLVGQGMKKSRGSANPEVLREMLKDIMK